jgi:hypothetical protein
MNTFLKKAKKIFSKNVDRITLISLFSLGVEKTLILIISIMLILKFTNYKENLFKFKLFDKNINETPEENDDHNKTSELKVNNKNEEKEIDISENFKENSHDIKSNKIKNNIKLMCNKMDSATKNKSDPYKNDVVMLEKNYKNDQAKHDFILNVNTTTCSTPIFNMRTYSDLGFYFNFIIHDFDSQKINNLIMCRDIHKWMSTSSLSNEDLEDEFCPIYYIKKINGHTDVFEYLKMFIHTDPNGVKICFVQKGIDFNEIKDDIDELTEKGLIKDLLCTKHYNNYNLSTNDGVSEFLEKFLSLVLMPESLIGEQVILDIENFTENKKTYEYHFNTMNSESTMFNTSI